MQKQRKNNKNKKQQKQKTKKKNQKTKTKLNKTKTNFRENYIKNNILSFQFGCNQVHSYLCNDWSMITYLLYC